MGWWHQKQETGAQENMPTVDIAAYEQGCFGAVVPGCCCQWWHNLQCVEASLPGASSGLQKSGLSHLPCHRWLCWFLLELMGT